jgi:hypothetical protein
LIVRHIPNPVLHHDNRPCRPSTHREGAAEAKVSADMAET